MFHVNNEVCKTLLRVNFDGLVHYMIGFSFVDIAWIVIVSNTIEANSSNQAKMKLVKLNNGEHVKSINIKQTCQDLNKPEPWNLNLKPQNLNTKTSIKNLSTRFYNLNPKSWTLNLILKNLNPKTLKHKP
jgi:hypothetical protein